VTVTPQQFLGIEVNPRAAAIAELVLWIGYLQWHYRAERRRTAAPADPGRPLPPSSCRDAVLAWDGVEPLLDDASQPVTRWDGRTVKRHPVTGEWTPDETARTPVYRYLNPRPAAWPAADFIVGNPPYIGTARMRELLGDGYAEAIRRVYPNVPDAADYVMYWWDKAADLVRGGQVQRFGFITTNSLRQVFNRRVLEHHLNAAAAAFAALCDPGSSVGRCRRRRRGARGDDHRRGGQASRNIADRRRPKSSWRRRHHVRGTGVAATVQRPDRVRICASAQMLLAPRPAAGKR
jgi:hypothetical protein